MKEREYLWWGSERVEMGCKYYFSVPENVSLTEFKKDPWSYFTDSKVKSEESIDDGTPILEGEPELMKDYTP
jgi:hypothetical protein